MCNLGTEIERKGRTEGQFETTAMYYKKGRISLEEAAADLKMTRDEFEKKVSRVEEGK